MVEIPAGVFRIGDETFTVTHARLWNSSYALPDLRNGTALAIEIECSSKRTAWGAYHAPSFRAWLPLPCFDGEPPLLIAEQKDMPWQGIETTTGERTPEAAIVVGDAGDVRDTVIRLDAAKRTLEVRGCCDDWFTGSDGSPKVRPEVRFVLVVDELEFPGQLPADNQGTQEQTTTPTPPLAQHLVRVVSVLKQLRERKLLVLSDIDNAIEALASAVAGHIRDGFDAITFVIALERNLDHAAVEELLGEFDELEREVAGVLASLSE